MLVQVMIAFLGAAAVWISQDPRASRARYACVPGLLSQPLWLIETWQAGQWGMFACAVVFTIGWGRGAVNLIRGG